MKINELYIRHDSIAWPLLEKSIYPFEVLPQIKDYIITLGKTLGEDFEEVKENVWIHKTAKVAPSAEINAPCIIDQESEIRHNVFIRGSAIVGKHCVVGNACELKNAILFDYVQVPHFNYVGDSILGYKAHLGAGSILANLKADGTNVTIRGETIFETNLRKVGSFLGDEVQIGCNCVLNPGTIVGSKTIVYPLTSLKGVIPANRIVKDKGNGLHCYERKNG